MLYTMQIVLRSFAQWIVRTLSDQEIGRWRVEMMMVMVVMVVMVAAVVVVMVVAVEV